MPNKPTTITPEPPDAADAPLISVIIPHFNDLANLERCLRLLAAQTLPRSKFEIVVADNNSRCGLTAVERICGDFARVVASPVQGAGAARNAGAEASRGRILAFIDSDCRPSPTWLERGLAALSNTDIVGGRVDVDYERPDSPTGVEAFERVFAFNFKRYVEKLGFAGAGNMFVPRETSRQSANFAVRSPRTRIGAAAQSQRTTDGATPMTPSSPTRLGAIGPNLLRRRARERPRLSPRRWKSRMEV
jgi:cellulose synthase/poly-beta-1,6-N-acetylglucosamine synthase-like glycosyltransferase